MMQPRGRRFIVPGILLIALIAAFNHLQAQTPKRVTNVAMCYVHYDPYVDPYTHHVTPFKGKHCGTTVSIGDNGSSVVISCGLSADCSDAYCVDPPETSYECAPATNTQGQTVWHCKGSFGTTMDNSTESNFTDNEFNNKATRCTRVCGGCSSGWK